MTTVHSSKKKPATHTESAPSNAEAAAAAPATAAAAPVASPVATAPPTTTSVPIIFVVQPPPPTVIPAVPGGFTPVDIAYYLGILPKAAQLTVMAGAIQELKEFSNYSEVFGITAPPQTSLLQAFDVAYQWSSVRAKMDTFDVYCQSQEALSWNEVHDYMSTMQTAFELAVKHDSSVGTEHPSLVRLFAAQKEIAQKGVATKKANKKAVAEGKPPTKGKVGKRRKSVAAQALFDAANRGTPSPTPAAPLAPAVSPPPVAPAANGVTGGTAGTTPSSNGANNGTPHS